MRNSFDEFDEFDEFKETVIEILNNNESYSLATKKHEDHIHKILEMESMVIKDFVEIKYSRRPHLLKSYNESGISPLIVIDDKKTSLGVIGEMSVYYNGKKADALYSCDLRISKNAPLKFRLKFRDIYLSVIKKMPVPCFTVVLKDNIRAIKALASEKKGIFYNPLFEYTSRSLLVLPTIKLLKKNHFDKKYSIEVANIESLAYLENKFKLSSFAHPITLDKNSYVIKEAGKIKGFFSTKRPKYKNLFINSNSMLVSLWIFIIKIFFGHNFNKKIPWHYIANLIIDDDMDQRFVLNYIMRYLHDNKKLKYGEIILICHPTNQKFIPNCLCPEFLTTGIFFKVSDKKEVFADNKPFYINPLYL